MLKLSVLKRWSYEVAANFSMEIYGMVVYKICLNTKIQVDETDKKRNRNWYGKIALILF